MKLSTKIIGGAALVITFSALGSYTNYLLSKTVSDNTRFLANSEAVIRNSHLLHKRILEMQSGFRGFLLTEDDSFLDSYEDGLKQIPGVIREGQELTMSTPQKIKIDSIILLHFQWIRYSKELIRTKRTSLQVPSTIKVYEKLFNNTLRSKAGKNINDLISTKFKEFNALEYEIRQSRRDMLQASIEETRKISLIFILLTVLASIAVTVYVVRSITRRIGLMVGLAEKIAQGDFYFVEDISQDELSSLTNSLNIMSEKLNKNIKQLENRNVELNQFASVVSHDLKAPLRGIHNVVSWVEEDLGGSLPDELKKYLAIIRERITRMENLINGLLDYARISREKPLKERVDLHESVQSIVDSIVPRDFNVSIERLPVISTEKIRLEQVFGNLISNAVKYSNNDHGKITISCKEYAGFYEFKVQDDGIGIDPQFHEKIFAIFQTLRDQGSDESTGMGLSIVKKILEEQQCTIRVESAFGSGSAFIFNWPKD